MTVSVPSYELGETPWIRLKSLRRTLGNSLVTSLDPGEVISFVVTNAAGETVEEGNSDDADVTHAESGTWWAQLTGLDELGVMRIKWTADVAGGISIWRDALRIKA